MKNQGSNLTDCEWQTRSVLECGSPLPLLGQSVTSRGALKGARGLAPSKTWRRFVAAFAFLATVIAGSAQTYSIDWHTIDGGGGTSTGGVYSVSGTIGQPDAGGPMTNGQYSVTGGFWALPTAIQVTAAPTLTIVPATPGNATISWTPDTAGFVLQETWVLSPANWTNSFSGATNPIVVPITLPTKFYRLFKP
jgi:hypothetical protein